MFNIFIVVCLKQETVEKPEEQCDHDKVGEEGGEPDDLPRRVETLMITHLVNITMIQA